MIAADLHLAIEHGLHLFPLHGVRGGRCDCGNEACDRPGKHPWLNRWKDIATTEPAQIERWTRRFRGCNWGVVTGDKSGVVVVDIDPRNGGDETLVGLPALPSTWCVQTGGGGQHYYFRHPGDGPISCDNTGKVGRGIDVKADGGYVVLPPSGHVSGRPYAWDVDAHPDEAALADLPAWVRERIERPASKPHEPINWPALFEAPVTEAGSGPSARGKAIAQRAGHLLCRGCDPHVVLDVLLGWNVRRCDPPLGEAEVTKIVTSIVNREAARRENPDAA